MNIIEIILIIANVALFTGLVSLHGLIAVAVGLIFEIAAMWLVVRLAHRRPRAGWMVLAATTGMISGTVRYSPEISPLTIAALILTAIFHGGIALILAEFLSNRR